MQGKLQIPIEKTSLPVIICNYNGKIVSENKPALKIFNLKAGRNYLNIEDLSENFSAYQNKRINILLQKQDGLLKEVPVQTKSGEIRLFNLHFNPYRNNNSGKTAILFLESSVDLQKSAKTLFNDDNLFDENPLMIFHITEKGKVIKVNKRGAEQLGYTKKELLDQDVVSVFVDEDKPKIMKHIKKCLKNPGKTFRWELQKIKKSGEIIWVNEYANVIDEKNGEKILSIACMDITAEKNNEQEIAKHQEKMQSMIDNSPLGVLLLELNDNDEFVLTGFNQSAARFVYLDLSEMIDQPVSEVFPAIKNGDLLGKYKEVATTGAPFYDYIFEYSEENNSLSYNISVIQTAERNIAMFFSDVTEKLKTLNELQQNQLKYQTLFDSANDAIFILHNNRFVDCNNYACKFLGYQKEELIGKSPDEISPDIQPNGIKSREAAFTRIKDSIEGHSQFFEWQHIKKDGSLVDTEVNLNRFELGEKEYIQAIVRDISFRKKVEEQLNEQRRTISTLMSNLPGMAYRCKPDDEWTMEYVSEGCMQLTGYTSEQLIENNYIAFSEIIHPEDVDKVWRSVFDQLKFQNYFTLLYRIITKQGIEKWVWEKGQGIDDENGNTIAIEGFITDITERISAEEKADRLAQALKSVSECVFISDLDNNITFVNNAFADSYGYHPSEIIGLPVSVIWSDSNSKELENEILRETFKGGWTGELLHKRKDLTEFPVYFSTSIIRDAEHKPLSIVGVSLDITERRISERALQESETRFRTLVESMVEAALIINKQGQIIFANNSAAHLVELSSPKEGIGRNVLEFTHPDYHQKLRLTLEKEIDSPQILFAEYKILTENKKEKWVESVGKRINFAGVVSILVTLRDISERKKSEEQIHLLTSALQFAANAILISDKEGKIIWVNGAFEKLTGYSQKEVIGRNPNILNAGIMPREFFESMWNTILKGETWHGELTNKRKGGIRYNEEMTIAPVKNDGMNITHYIAIKQDITQRIVAERELKKAKEKAEIMNKIKSNFLANISHELRTPLVGILGFAELIKEEIDDPVHADMADRIYQSGKRLMETLNSVLDLSRIEANRVEINFKRINLKNLISEQVRLFEGAAIKKHLYIRFEKNSENIFANIDEHLLRQILNNLLNNSVKYTHQGGLKIKLDRAIYEKTDYARIRITDTGIGIPKESIEMIFQEFRQVSEGFSRHFEGTGLGLTITKRFVDLMDGRIWVESTLNRGSTFTVIFPLIEASGPSSLSDTTAELINPASGNGNNNKSSVKKMLLVENDEASREITKLFLRNVAEIHSASSGEEALNLIRENKYSIILMDINLGTGLSGIETTKRIREMEGYESVPIVAVTAFAMSGDKEEFLAAGCSHYISKPFSRKQILDLVQQATEIKKSDQQPG